MDQTQTPRYVSRFEHPALRLRFTQKDFQSTKTSTKDFPHREPPLRILGNTTRRTHLLSPTTTTSTQEAKAQSLNTSQQPPHHKRVSTSQQAKATTSPQEGYQKAITSFTQEEQQNESKFTT